MWRGRLCTFEHESRHLRRTLQLDEIALELERSIARQHDRAYAIVAHRQDAACDPESAGDIGGDCRQLSPFRSRRVLST